MTIPSPQEVTQLLLAWSQGDRSALDKLIPLVYKELRRLAKRGLDRERPGHPLQATALVHEAYLRLIDMSQIRWQDRSHFFAIASRLMRRILVDYARKRRGERCQVSLDEVLLISPGRNADLVSLDEALSALAVIDSRKSLVVELRFFGGLSLERTAEVLEVSTKTVQRDWQMAKVWLLRELSRKEEQEGKR